MTPGRDGHAAGGPDRRPAPKVSSIPPTDSFVDSLARGLLRRYPDPLDLARVTLLLPTRRACRALQEAFLRASDGQPLLLPRFRPLGDVDAEELILTGGEALPEGDAALDLPPAMPPLVRRLLLTRAILSWSRRQGQAGVPSEDQAALLAEELGRLIDQVETEGLDFAGLEGLAPEAYAEHWQRTLAFLSIVTEHWPAIQGERGCIGAADLRRRLHEAQAEAWRVAPPAYPVIAAGSTGSIPSTAALLAVVARLPLGEVVLPGLDGAADAATWAAIGDDPSHPQHGLHRLLQVLGVVRRQVGVWAAADRNASVEARTPALRPRILAAALRPAVCTAAWPDLKPSFDVEAVRLALRGVTRVGCADSGEEAGVVALLLRQALEQPGRRAALVTPDRGLARRVAAELRRWEIEVDDSAGKPLAETAPGAFLRLTAQLVEADFAPLPLLACLKHPLAAGGQSPAAFRAAVRRLEVALLRGPRPAPGLAGLRAALAAKRAEAEALGRNEAAEGLRRLGRWLAGLERLLRPFAEAARRGGSLSTILAAHIACTEALAASDGESGAARLWARDEGEVAARFVAEFDAATRAEGISPSRAGGQSGGGGGSSGLTGRDYAGLLDSLLAGQVVRPAFGQHPRLAILGPLEARLLQTDLLVLGGLNEGSWPAETDPGPWMSRPMRAAFGLPALERRIGQAAHDFTQAMGATRVVLTRARRAEGAPTRPSRWLLRLDAFLEAIGAPDALREERPYVEWGRALDRPVRTEACARPAPCPPLAARPRRLSVTQIERWMRDPYGVYARHILKLSPLDPLDQDPGAADRGTLVHEALERFLKAYPGALDTAAEAAARAELHRLGEEVFAPLRAFPGLHAFWLPRFHRIADWVFQQELERRSAGPALFGEIEGRLEIGDFTLTAKADRIERWADGSLTLIDYKTGQPPKAGDIALGFSPQLPLEAAIAGAGGFAGLQPGAPRELIHWRLSGGEPPGEMRPVKGDPLELAEAARAGLVALIAEFERADTPYLAVPRPEHAPAFNDYAHLERIKEWSTAGEGEEG